MEKHVSENDRQHGSRRSLAIGCMRYLRISRENMFFRRCGKSPTMCVFGRIPRVPGILLTDESNVLNFEARSQDEQIAFAERCRTEALRAFAEEEATTHIRRSMLRRIRSVKDHEFAPGQKVGFFRAQGLAGRRRQPGGASMRPGYLIGTFVCKQPNGNNSVSYTHLTLPTIYSV